MNTLIISNSSNSSNILQFMKKYQIATYQQLLKRSVENIEWYWNAVNEDLSLEWFHKYNQVFDSSEGYPRTKWFLDGKCNIVYNAVDRHAKRHPDKIAYIFENERGISKRISYQQLLRYIECAPPSLSLSSIPDHGSWIVTMWHFGYDSSNEYTNDDFEVA